MRKGIIMIAALLALLAAGCAGGRVNGHTGSATDGVTVVSTYHHRERANAVVVNGRIRNDTDHSIEDIVVKVEVRDAHGAVLACGEDAGFRLQAGQLAEYRIALTGVPPGILFTPQVWIDRATFGL